MFKKSESMDSTNRHIDRTFLKIGLYLFIFGMLLPNDWRNIFGIFFEPISWVAGVIPSIKKIAAISPISELVQGFFGGAFLFLPLFYAAIIRRDSIGLRFNNSLDRATSKFKFVLLIYSTALLSMLFLYYILFLPGEVRLGLTPTRGQAAFSLMVSYRFTLALFGSLLIMGVCGFLWIVTIATIGPLSYFTKRMNSHDISKG